MFVKAKKDARNVIAVISKSSFQKAPEELYSMVMFQLTASKEKAPVKTRVFLFFFQGCVLRSCFG